MCQLGGRVPRPRRAAGAERSRAGLVSVPVRDWCAALGVAQRLRSGYCWVALCRCLCLGRVAGPAPKQGPPCTRCAHARPGSGLCVADGRGVCRGRWSSTHALLLSFFVPAVSRHAGDDRVSVLGVGKRAFRSPATQTSTASSHTMSMRLFRAGGCGRKCLCATCRALRAGTTGPASTGRAGDLPLCCWAGRRQTPCQTRRRWSP